MDDSVCILYEKLVPPPEVEIVHEVEGHHTEEDILQIVEEDIRNINHRRLAVRAPGNSARTNRASAESASLDDNTVYYDALDDDSVCILQENKPPQPKTSSKNVENIAASSSNQQKLNIECGICFDSLNVILDSNRTLGSTVCGHIFCNSCMETSRKNSNLCPACRKRLGKNQFHPLYF